LARRSATGRAVDRYRLAVTTAKDDVDFEVPDWFWDVIEAARPNLMALESWLVAAPKATVEQYGFHYDTASLALAEYASAIEVDGTVWSEDDMADLCHWIVGEGRTYWQSVVDGDRTLLEAARTYGDPAHHWNDEVANPNHRGYQSPWGIAHGVYWSRFGKALNEVIDDPNYQAEH
jgi:hypothetical protein